jgi:hypothetical protein
MKLPGLTKRLGAPVLDWATDEPLETQRTQRVAEKIEK